MGAQLFSGVRQPLAPKSTETLWATSFEQSRDQRQVFWDVL